MTTVKRPAARRRLRALLALFLAVTLPLAGLPLAPHLGSTSAANGWNYAADRDRLLPELPEEPAAAAMDLVDLIFDEDFEVAIFAAMELIRRAGMPLTNLDGMVVALPDDIVLVDAAVQGEFVPALARSVRAGDFYTVEELGFLLVDGGFFEEPLPLQALVAGLGRWGKGDEDPAAVATAGAAVRALGAKRGDVYYAQADPAQAQLDPLQVLIIVSHLAADAYPPPSTAARWPLARLLGVGIARAAGDEGCARALEEYEGFKKPPEGIDKQTWEFFLEGAKEATGKDLSVPNPADAFKKKGGIDRGKVSAVITTLLWITGIRMDLTADPKKTHFGPPNHDADDAGAEVLVTAYAHFVFPLSKNGAACLKLLADVDAFPQGPLPDFKVRWSIRQPGSATGRIQEDGKLLKPLDAYSNAFNPNTAGGDRTDDHGESNVVLTPAYEKRPGQGTAKTEYATITASLDKEDFPFKLKDLFKLKDPRKFAIDKIFDLANSAIRRLGLPKQSVVVPVEYHGTEILAIEGETTLFALYYFLPLYVRVWTCDGLKGTWQGSAGFTGERTILGEAASEIFDVPANAAMEKEQDFFLDLTGDGFDRATLLETIGMNVEVDWRASTPTYLRSGPVAIAQARGKGLVIGNAELTIAGQSAGPLAIFDGRSATFDVRRYRPGERTDLCPNAEVDSYFP